MAQVREAQLELPNELATRAPAASRSFSTARSKGTSTGGCQAVDRRVCNDGTHVPAKAIPALRRLVHDVLEPLRTKFGACTVNSGYRTVSWNKHVKGEDNSQHIYELSPRDVAADVVFKRGSPREWGDEAERLLHGGGGLGRYSGFIHVDNRRGPARW